MKRPDLPPMQGKRFDVETLPINTICLMKQADEGSTFLRHAGRVTHAIMTEELFDALWPDPGRARSICEMPLCAERLRFEALNSSFADSKRPIWTACRAA